MDFGTLLSVAQKNENNKQSNACYQTKFAPPKKPTKQAKALSQNIKKFLARKEEEEKLKSLEEQKKRENLLALRDHKTQSRINKHLKVCKAANKSVLADAIDNENTAVTMAGPSQPDEDDYGYVSQEASAFYNQLMSKYNTSTQKPLFSDNRKKTIKDIASTKDRVKQALKQKEAEDALGHRRKRKSSAKETETESEEKIEESVRDEKKEREEIPKPKKRSMPPPLDFSELLKIAEKKQHEPIVIDVKPKTYEPERLMTKKQMMEFAKEKEWREGKDQRTKGGNTNSKEGTAATPSKLGKIPINRGGVNAADKPSKGSEKLTTSSTSNKASSQATTGTTSSVPKKIVEKSNENKASINKPTVSKISERDIISEERRKLEMERKKLEEMRQVIEEEKKKLKLSKSKIDDTKIAKPEKSMSKVKVLEKQTSSKSIKQRDVPITNAAKCRTPVVENDRIKPFLPPDLKPVKSRPTFPPKEYKRPLAAHRRRIQDNDDEEEYDSELDDFIDDGVQEESEDYSKHISEIFGYDKSKYEYMDNEDDVDMESSFAQQLKEEYVSAKIGIMEDLEDMRMEALEKKRKALFKQKLKK